MAAEDRRYGTGEQINWHDEQPVISVSAEIDYYQKAYEYFALDKKAFVPIEQTREVMRILEVCREQIDKS